jgi:CheY-like chemotaxis protein
MELDPARVQEQFRSLTRFRRVSVVVADYGMPAMSGLDLCSRIVDEAIQKVLITGLADHREVIQAFGERSIQGFIPKERPTLFSELVHDVRELRRQYFIEKARYLKTHLGMESAPFALDPVVSDYFSKICGRLEIAEHYIVQEPPGILMVSSRGLVHRLVVLDESQLHDQISVVRACGAPLEVEQAIRSKAKAVALDYSLLKQRAESHPWESLLIDLERLVGCQSWYVGLASDTRATDLQYVASYLSYVEELDGRY